MEPDEIMGRIDSRESFLRASDDQFLGTLSLNRYSYDSISNPYGNYGSRYSNTSIFNPYGNYGSPYSSLSPYNHYSSTPPVIYLKGQFYGYLTKNQYVGINVVDPDNLIYWMKDNGLNY